MVSKDLLTKEGGKLQQKLIIEQEIMRNLKHPNIVNLYESIETENHVCLVLEYC
jgi:serine/threonine protein kinase